MAKGYTHVPAAVLVHYRKPHAVAGFDLATLFRRSL